MSLKETVRGWVVRSARPPLDGLYKAAYRAVIDVATRLLRRHRAVKAIYVLRGCARGEITPGISDIDLAVVVEDGIGDEARAAVQRDGDRLARATGGLVDFHYRVVVTEAELLRRWRWNASWRYVYDEARTSATLVHGEDVLAGLPPLSPMQRRSAGWAELNRWWYLFAARLLASDRHHRDPMVRNVVCAKAAGELLGLRRGFIAGGPRRSRLEVLDAEGTPLARRLAALARRRYAGDAPGLIDETLRFMVRSFVEMWDGFAAEPFLAVDPGCRQSLGDGTIETPAAARPYLEAVRRRLPARAVTSAFFDLDDVLIVADVDDDRLPGAAEMAGLAALAGPHRLFVRIGGVAFPVTPRVPQDILRVILTPATVPDVFLRLGVEPVYWTDFTRWYLCDWRDNERWVGAPEEKRRQLDRIAEGARRGQVTYPGSGP